MKYATNFKSFLISTLFISILYLISVTYLMNFELVKDSLLGNHSFSYRINLLIALIGGMWTAMSGFSLFILIITSLLTGINLTLIAQRISVLKFAGNLRLTVGGGTLLGFIGSGCAACGLPVLALLGLSGSVAYLPLRGTEFSIIAVALLTLSTYIMLKFDSQKMTCAVNIRTQSL